MKYGWLQLFGGYDSNVYYSPEDGGGGGGTDEDEPVEPKPITFKDEAALMARMGRHAKGEQDKQAKALGYDSYADMVEAAKAARAKSDEEKTESVKQKERADAAEAKSADALARSNARLIKAEVKVVAKDLEFADADDAFALMDRSGIEVDDEDNVKGVKEALTKLLKAKPHLKGTTAPGKGGGDFSGGKGDTKPKTLRDAIAATLAKQR